MGMKMGIVLGFSVGYVLGTRAGHEQYERICQLASRVRQVPIVAAPLDRAGNALSDVVRAQGERVTDKVADAVKERLFGMPVTRDEAPLADSAHSDGSARASSSHTSSR